ncbi:alanine--tRNA ligase [Mycoplasmopsis alligatoris]|uniref:Alanine--tRNA ligase n=1 Tax=Mycoplasmopsis alligatoris A21JP2 TaxID=747682 RepID=D4XWY8_9BACT|nr:alanine--tRNA ligase [Mycoplasmopsis alligatoris]EFF41148.1 alanine--tRNA ligase [Mycoplasmopsis alligatoris A21JP2]
MNSKKIRQDWLNFWEQKQHLIVPTKSLVPVNDNSLLWINSGVATLKDYFSGKKNPPSLRLTNSQKAIRTNDIENVGITARHHTFFEMLGNFSIGDYFKKEAIYWASEYLNNILKLDKEKLFFTYFHEDLETKKLWMDCGYDESHMIPGDKKTNFWEVGSGPCGPNTEIFYDRGAKYDSRGIELLKEDLENDRYIEIWNIVFSTYNSDGEGNYTELKQKNIDTGAGLERIVSIMQDAPTNYDSDLFIPIIQEIEKYVEFKYDTNNYFKKDLEQEKINTSFKIIADHIRTVANAIADGAKVSNVGRGYILRRLIRRSIYKGMQLKVKSSLFLYKLVKIVKSTLPYEYDTKKVEKAIKEEEELFAKTIEKGRKLLEKNLEDNTKIFSGETTFKLLETYGFPLELTKEILEEKNISINMEEFEQAKQNHANASRGKKISGMDKVINSLSLLKSKIDNFVGYEQVEITSKILKLFNTENEIEQNDGISYLILESTPFYATSGGQKHDRGHLIQDKNKLIIIDVFKDKFGNHIHKVKGKINKKLPIECFVDKTIRLGLERNHSGTHLLYCALRNILGKQIVQLGSDNNEERLTFDLPADTKPTNEEILKIEKLVKTYIQQDAKREYLQMSIDKAKQINAILTLEEGEYMDQNNVRIVKFDNITADLCGGTHLSNTAKLENFKIVEVEKKSAGVFRIKAISSNKLVNDYLTKEIEKFELELNVVITKIKDFDKNYSVLLNNKNDLSNYLESIKIAIDKANNDLKDFSKKSQKQADFDFESVEFIKIKNYLLSFTSAQNPGQVKLISTTLREKNNQSINLAYFAEGKNLTISLASKVIDSNQYLQKIFTKFNGRGGGNAIMSMGKCLANPNDIFEYIKELLNA